MSPYTPYILLAIISIGFTWASVRISLRSLDHADEMARILGDLLKRKDSSR